MKRHFKFAAFVLMAAIAFVLVSCNMSMNIDQKEKTYASPVSFTATKNSDGSVSVTMTTTTGGAKIYYTTDGGTPTAQSTEYSADNKPTVTADTTFKAIAIKSGIENSSVSTAVVSITTNTVTETVTQTVEKTYASPVTFSTTKNANGSVSVTMTTTTNGAKIYYTTDGSAPTAQRAEYSADNKPTVTADTTFKAIAIKSGIENSPVSVAVVSITTNTVTQTVEKTYASPVTFSTTANANGSVTVTMTSETEGALIYYTTDGTAPTASSTEYSASNKPIVSTNTTFKAIAIKTGMENSPVSTANITMIDKKADETAPSNVTNLTAMSRESAILLTWTNATDNDIYGYEVSCNGTSASSRIVLPAINAQSMMVSKDAGGCYVSGLTNGTQYTFTVKSVDTSGNKSVGVTVIAAPSPAGFVAVTGATVSGAVSGSSVFIEGRTITIPDLLVCDHEVTQAEYQTVMGSNPSYFQGESYPAAEGETQGNRPVECVSWYDAIAYCNKRSLAENLTPCYSVSGVTDWANLSYSGIPTSSNSNWNNATCNWSANGYRLPTEAEWEYIARGGDNGIPTEQTTYSGSDTIGNVAWYTNNSGDKTHEVKKKTANALGLYDMSGNVWEWCWDWYGSISASSDQAGAASGSVRVERGGGWECIASSCTVSFRFNHGYPYLRNSYYGFRVVRTAKSGFVAVTGATVSGAVSGSSVFISGRTVTIPNLLVCDHEVTQMEYQTVMGSNPSFFQGESYPAAEGETQTNRPVEQVSWYDALVYCNKRSIAENLIPCYTIGGSTNPADWGAVPTSSDNTWNAATCNFSANGYRLPTEAEWEYIVRGGNNGIPTEQTMYSGSNTIGDVAWYTDNSGSKTHEVKKKTANALGLYDMSGNVWEWCWDWYGSISSSTVSAGAASGSNRVIRGGSWYYDASHCTVSRRHYRSPCIRNYYSGFRVVRTEQ